MSSGSQKLFPKILEETEQTHEVRRPQILQIEKHFKKRVVTFQTSGAGHVPNSSIIDSDVNMLEEALLGSNIRENLLLIIDSHGGSGLAAERIIRVCQKYSKGSFDVLVPYIAKSAATLICFGAKKIWLGETSELGPIDPQCQIGDLYISAYNYVKSYEGLMRKASTTKGRVEPYLQQLAEYNDALIVDLKQETKLSEEMAIQCLKSGMMKKFTKAQIRRKIKKFTDPSQTLQHGRPIFYEDAKKCGLLVGLVRISDPIWDTIWELHLRYQHILSSQCAKVIETRDIQYSVPIARRSSE